MPNNGKIEIKKGKDFIPGTSTSYLKALLRKEKDAAVCLRVLACMHRKDGMSIRKIAKTLNRKYSTVYSWLARMQEGGIRRRFNDKRPGRKSFLTEQQTKQLAADLDKGPESCGFESSVWDYKMVAHYIKKKFGAEYTRWGARLLLKRMNFSWKKARPRHPKAASKRM